MENKYLPEKKQFHYQMPIPSSDSGSLRIALRIIFRQKHYIVGFFVFTVLSVLIFTLITPKVYQSDAKIFIQVGRENVSLDPSVVGPIAAVRSDRETELNSEVSALRNRVLIEQAVEDLGTKTILYPGDGELTKNAEQGTTFSLSRLLVKMGIKTPVPEKEIAIEKVSQNLSIGAEKLTHIIALSYQAESPELARDTLNVLIDKYRDQHIEMHRAQAPLRFFEERTETLRKVLQDKENQLKNFLAENSIASMDEQKTRLMEQVGLLQIEADQVSSLIGASNAKINTISNNLQGRSPNHELSRVVGRPNRTVEIIKTRLFELQTQETDLAAHYPDTDRSLIELREKIRQAKKQLSMESKSLTEVTQGVDTNYQSLQLSLANEQAELQALNARQEIVTSKLAERRAELLNLSSHETTLNNLQRDIDIANEEYQQYRGSLQRAKLSEELDVSRISNVSIIQPPSLSYVPVSPRKTLNLLMGLFLGVTGGLGLAFFREYFDNSIKGTEDVEEKLGLPVLASISRQEFKTCT
jgi:uncharacterized protein involved in exopolysaccharide biosynthesis